MDNIVINSLPHHNDACSLVPNSKLIIQTIWNDESITVSMSNDKIGYSGILLQSAIRTTANALELDVDEFMADVKNALCTPNGQPNFTYHLNRESKTFKFCKATSRDVRITYGELQLAERPDAIDDILMNSIKSNEAKEHQIHTLRSEMQRMHATFNEMKIALEKCVEEKVQMENGLLTKFAALLNAKKGRIAELENSIKNRSFDVADDDFESDGSGDSDLDYSSQSCVRRKSPTIASPPPASNQSVSNDSVVAMVPKRRNNKQVINETIVESNSCDGGNDGPTKPESMDIYDRETEVLLDDM